MFDSASDVGIGHAPSPPLGGARDSIARRLATSIRAVGARHRRRRTLASAIAHARAARALDDHALDIALRGCRLHRRRSREEALARGLGLLLVKCRRNGQGALARTELEASIEILDRGVFAGTDAGARARASGLAAALAVLSGRNVHVVAADEAQAMAVAAGAGAVLDAAGIAWGTLQEAQSLQRRRAELRRPVVFAAVRLLARDCMSLAVADTQARSQTQQSLVSLAREIGGSPFQPPNLDLAIVEGIETVLCERGNERIIVPARAEAAHGTLAEQVGGLADQLEEDRDYRQNAAGAELTAAGRDRIDTLGGMLGLPWTSLPPLERKGLVEAALTLEALGPDDFETEDGRAAPRSEPALAAVARAGEHRNVVIEIATRRLAPAGFRRRIATQISVHRFLSRYRQLGGTINPGTDAGPELAGRFGLIAACPRAGMPSGRRLVVVDDRAAAEAALIAAINANRQVDAPTLVIDASPGPDAALAGRLARDGIASVELQGVPSAADATLIGDALASPGAVVLATPGRQLASGWPPSRADGMPMAHLVILGAGTGSASPDALLAGMDLRAFAARITLIVPIGEGAMSRHLGRFGRTLLPWLARRDGGLFQLTAWLVLRHALARATRLRRRAQSRFYLREAQDIASLTFIGAKSERL